MNIYSGGRNTFIDVGSVVYWLTLKADQTLPEITNKIDFFDILTGSQVSSEQVSGSGKPVIRLFEGDNYRLTMSRSTDKKGFDDFVLTLAKYIERNNSDTYKGHSAFYSVDEGQSFEVHLYKKDVARNFNMRPNLPADRDEFVDWCL